MRVVAGTARGRRLTAPAGRGTRPTSDRVREAIFSMLTAIGAVEGASVVDLFAGSGALGIEALSRGAAAAVFVDSDRSAKEAIEANLAVLGPRSAVPATVVVADAIRYAAGMGPAALVLADPPYAFDRWGELLEVLHERAGVVVCETGGPLDPGPAWETVRVRTYGGTVVTVIQPLPMHPDTPPHRRPSTPGAVVDTPAQPEGDI